MHCACVVIRSRNVSERTDLAGLQSKNGQIHNECTVIFVHFCNFSCRLRLLTKLDRKTEKQKYYSKGEECVRTYLHAYVCTYILTCVCMYVHTYMRMYVRMHVHVHAYVRNCVSYTYKRSFDFELCRITYSSAFTCLLSCFISSMTLLPSSLL